MTVMPLPPGYEWGFVVAKSIHAMADTTEDENRFPEARGSNGRVTFTPLVRSRIAEVDPDTFVHYEIVRAEMRNGDILDAQKHLGIWLITGWYSVSFQIEGGSIPSFEFEVKNTHTEETPCNLASVAPVVAPPGYIEVTRVEDRVRAETAAENAEGFSAAAGGSASDALGYRNVAEGHAQTAAGHAANALASKEATEALGITIDTSAGTVVRLGGLLLSGDTGQRIMNEQLHEGWTAEYVIMLSRVNSTVTLLMYGLTRGEESSMRFMNLPAGFRPQLRNVTMLATSTSTIEARRFEADLGLGGSFGRVGDAYNGVQVQWYTNDAWPNSLPGTPA